MVILALDTCDARGSIAVLRDSQLLSLENHPFAEDYSTWLIPAADRVLASLGLSHADVEGYAVAAGPGSFTGVRIGLTAVKAWAEVFCKPVASISRLQAVASACSASAGPVVAFVDAQRGQLFGGLYLRSGDGLQLVEDEMVMPPAAFLDWVASRTKDAQVAWASLDPHLVTNLDGWAWRGASGERVEQVSPDLAPRIGVLGLQQLIRQQGTDALKLDANYVRRSDAELFWKKSATP
jgi:tRNA threonylcarbamoyladenosine biosynthesis protein TsaB